MFKIYSKHTKSAIKYQFYLENNGQVVNEIEHPDPQIALEQARELGKKLYWGLNGPEWGRAVRIRKVHDKKRASNWLKKLCAKKILIADDLHRNAYRNFPLLTSHLE